MVIKANAPVRPELGLPDSQGVKKIDKRDERAERAHRRDARKGGGNLSDGEIDKHKDKENETPSNHFDIATPPSWKGRMDLRRALEIRKSSMNDGNGEKTVLSPRAQLWFTAYERRQSELANQTLSSSQGVADLQTALVENLTDEHTEAAFKEAARPADAALADMTNNMGTGMADDTVDNDDKMDTDVSRPELFPLSSSPGFEQHAKQHKSATSMVEAMLSQVAEAERKEAERRQWLADQRAMEERKKAELAKEKETDNPVLSAMLEERKKLNAMVATNQKSLDAVKAEQVKAKETADEIRKRVEEVKKEHNEGKQAVDGLRTEISTVKNSMDTFKTTVEGTLTNIPNLIKEEVAKGVSNTDAFKQIQHELASTKWVTRIFREAIINSQMRENRLKARCHGPRDMSTADRENELRKYLGDYDKFTVWRKRTGEWLGTADVVYKTDEAKTNAMEEFKKT